LGELRGKYIAGDRPFLPEPGAHRCYTPYVPTKLRRHALTETPPVRAALDDVRHATRTDDVDIAELVILGAREKLARLRAEELQANELVDRLAERIRTGNIPVDVSAADEVRRSGWVRS
jgi:hypothetical protein